MANTKRNINDERNHLYKQLVRIIRAKQPAFFLAENVKGIISLDKGGVVVLHHPNNRRQMTCRELTTAQSFPADYVFSGNRTSIYRQIGNAVPPLLANALAKQFKRYIEEQCYYA